VLSPPAARSSSASSLPARPAGASQPLARAGDGSSQPARPAGALQPLARAGDGSLLPAPRPAGASAPRPTVALAPTLRGRRSGLPTTAGLKIILDEARINETFRRLDAADAELRADSRVLALRVDNVVALLHDMRRASRASLSTSAGRRSARG